MVISASGLNLITPSAVRPTLAALLVGTRRSTGERLFEVDREVRLGHQIGQPRLPGKPDG